MRTFFRFIRNIFLLALLAFGVWTYKNNPNFQIATNDSLATLSYRINQLLTSGTATAPKNGVNPNTKTDTDKTENDNSSETRVWSEPEANVYVDIKGAVHHPGAYQMAAQQRVGDAVQKAGGYTPEADPNQVNLAQKITDQMVIYIPRRGEKIPIVNSTSGQNSGTTLNPTATESNSNGKVNLNTATLEQLKGLTGVGEKKAQKIIEYRQQHGQFKSVEELKNVNGFGEKSLATLAEQICV